MKRPITIVSTISGLLFLTAIIWFGAGIYIDKKNGTAKADARYEKLLSDTKQNFSTHSYGTSEFANNFIQSIGNIDDFSTLKLEINGELVYSYPPGLFSLPSPKLVKTYQETVFSAGKNFTLEASVYLLSPDSIYIHSRFAFILILAGTLIALLVIIMMGSTEKSKDYMSYSDSIRKYADLSSKSTKKEDSIIEKQKDVEEKPKDKEEESKEPQRAEVLPEENAESSSEETISIQFPEEEPVLSKEDEIEWNDEELFDEENQESDSTETEERLTEDEDEGGLDIIDQFEQENQQLADEDLFSDVFEEKDEDTVSEEEKQVSPVTQIQLQAGIEQRLNDYIDNGKSDATLALLKINGLDRGNSISQNIISILKENCSPDNIFEYKADAYALIMPEENLQNSVDKFEELYNKISSYLKNNNAVNEVSVGISSVSKRAIRAERIILEASQALDYASKDPDSPIVAFRANPDKYKEFVENQ